MGKHIVKHMSQVSYPEYTFQVQILGTIDTLTSGCSIYFQRVGVAVISGDSHIMPLIVI